MTRRVSVVLGLVFLGALGLVACSDGEAATGLGDAIDTFDARPDTTVFGFEPNPHPVDSGSIDDAAPADLPPAEADADRAAPELPPPTPDSGPDAAVVDVDVAAPDAGPCVPNCQWKDCGLDGCGGSCGACDNAEICSSAGTCDPDPAAGCAGLELAENWVGTFDGDASFNILYNLVPIEGSAHGDMAFSISCLNSKFIVSGTMSGTASKNDFKLGLSGTYNPKTKTMTAKVVDGTVFVLTVVTYFEFAGDIVGVLGADGTFTGDLDVKAVSATTLFNVLDPATYSAWAKCSWDAAPQ